MICLAEAYVPGRALAEEVAQDAWLGVLQARPRRGMAGHPGLLAGELTIRGIALPVILAAECLGYAADPWGRQRAIFTAAITLNRGTGA